MLHSRMCRTPACLVQPTHPTTPKQQQGPPHTVTETVGHAMGLSGASSLQQAMALTLSSCFLRHTHSKPCCFMCADTQCGKLELLVKFDGMKR